MYCYISIGSTDEGSGLAVKKTQHQTAHQRTMPGQSTLSEELSLRLAVKVGQKLRSLRNEGRLRKETDA